MARPLRIEFPYAVYHVTSRGDRREPIYRDDADRELQLAVIAQAMGRFDASVLAYCLMGNHYHLVVQTRQANLSRLMRQVNGVYTQAFNRRHGLTGHLFQGRFKAILVDSDRYLATLCRYVERNPVAAGLVASVGGWVWSSALAHLGNAPTPPWLDTDGVLAQMIGRPVMSADDRTAAQREYQGLLTGVEGDIADGSALWQTGLLQQIFLGDANFIEQAQALMAPQRRSATDIPKAQRCAPALHPLATLRESRDRDEAIGRAYRDGGHTMTEIAAALGLSLNP